MKLLRTAVLLACATWPVLTSTAAGPSSGSLRGAVRSRTGERLSGVVVRAVSQALQSTRVAATGPAGGFLLRGLPPGRYTVSFERTGFATHEQRKTLRAGVDARLDVTLRPSDFDTTIVVTGELTEVADRAALGLVLGRDDVDRLPLGRSLDRFAALSPNVASASLATVGRSPPPLVMAGAEGGSHLRLVDGVDISDPLEGVSVDLFVPEAVTEILTASSAVPVEYGRFAGGVASAVTERGGRGLHGSLRLRLTNPAWRDETPFETAEGIAHENRGRATLEAGLGGAVRADDLWFFLAGMDGDTSSPETLRLTREPSRRDLEERRYQLKLSGAVGDRHALVGGHADAERDEDGPAHPAGSTLDTLLRSTRRRDLTHLRYAGVLGRRLFVEGSSARTRGEVGSRGAADRVAGTPFVCLGPEPACQYGAPLADSTDPGRFSSDETTASVGLFVDSRAAGSHDLSAGLGRLDSSLRGGRSRSPTDAVIVRDPVLREGALVPHWSSPADGAVDRGYGVFQTADRGFASERVTEYAFVSDSWRPHDRWTLDLGLRSERVSVAREPGVARLDFDSLAPRLGAAFDVAGDGRYVLRTTYAEYSDATGSAAAAWLREPDRLFATYVGPSGSGLDFAPGRDPDNYRTVGAWVPGGNLSVAPETGLGEIAEWTLSSATQLGYGGHVRLTYVDRRWRDRAAETIVPANGASTTADGTLVDNVLVRSSRLLDRLYAAVVLEGRLPPVGRWSFDGHWTRQLENEGASGGAALLAYPEIHDARNAPVGPLADFQRDRVRLWTTFRRSLSHGGAVSASLLFGYDSARRYSLTERRPLTSVQRAILTASGYVGEPVAPLLFYGAANDREFSSTRTLDLAVRYGRPAGSRLEPWLQVEVLNLLGEDALVAWDTTVVGDPAGPVDTLGRPTTFVRGETFGSARDSRDHVAPRELRVSLGLRF